MVAIFAIFLPQGKAPMASFNGGTVLSYTYPVPLSKPYQCTSEIGQENTNDNISKKQAIAAALGIYFGVKHANTPHIETNNLTSLCV